MVREIRQLATLYRLTRLPAIGTQGASLQPPSVHHGMVRQRLSRGPTLATILASAVHHRNCSDARLMFRHLLPNSLGPIVTRSTMNLSWAILNAAGLSLL